MLQKIELANRIAKLKERGDALDTLLSKEGDGGGAAPAGPSGSGPTPAAVHVDQAMGGGNAPKKEKKKVAKEDVKKFGNANCGQFVAAIMHASTVAHIMHLKASSLAEHMALGELYEGLPELIDSFAEVCQGRYGLITGYPEAVSIPQDSSILFVRSLQDMVDGQRQLLPQNSHLQNIVDEIVALIDRTAYKLVFLS